MFDITKMMGKMKEVQEKMKEAQAKVALLEETGEAGAGMVKVVVNGSRKIVSIDIDQDLLTKDDKETVEDLTVAAVNQAMDKIEVKIKEEMKHTTSGMLPNIPGMDFGNMF